MKKLFPVLIGIALFALPSMAIAGVSGTLHDLGATEGPCISCHIPHGAQGGVGGFLWPSTPDGSYSDQRSLCVTCHDGTGDEPGFTTVFDLSLQQHKFPSVMSIPDCSGDDACHDVHNQGTDGQFLQVAQTSASFCITCHDATQWNNTHGDHTAGTQHQMTGGFSCENCHVIHGAPADANPVGGLTNPILWSSNSDGTNYGPFCVSCHQGTAPDTITFSDILYGGTAASDTFTYTEIVVNGDELKHPTQGGNSGNPAITGCDECHDPHNSATAPTVYDFALIENNKDSDYCESCHSGLSGNPGITVGDGSTHYVGTGHPDTLNNGLSPALPWADEIDDDGDVGPDYTGATADMMVCETCHSVHRNGVAGPAGSTNFLRNTYASSTLCGECHTDNL